MCVYKKQEGRKKSKIAKEKQRWRNMLVKDIPRREKAGRVLVPFQAEKSKIPSLLFFQNIPKVISSSHPTYLISVQWWRRDFPRCIFGKVKSLTVGSIH